MSTQEELIKLIQELQLEVKELKKKLEEKEKTIEELSSQKAISITDKVLKKLQEEQELSADVMSKVDKCVDLIIKYAQAIGF